MRNIILSVLVITLLGCTNKKHISEVEVIIEKKENCPPLPLRGKSEDRQPKFLYNDVTILFNGKKYTGVIFDNFPDESVHFQYSVKEGKLKNKTGN